jgi:predicted HAD superfamily Cof-like phosphohydrolase
MGQNKQLRQVEEFHEAFNAPIAKKLTIIPEERYHLRSNLLMEENQEYLKACLEGDVTEIADALGDMLYILCGTMVEHGFQGYMEKVFTEIHKSNMSKLGVDGKPVYREDGKILKGPHFFRPRLTQVISKVERNMSDK